MEDKPNPQGSPSIPPISWIDEIAAVMDLYLLALAWESTEADGNHAINRFSTFTHGTEITEYMGDRAPKFFEAYLRSFYRICVFRALFGPRIFTKPVLDAMERFGKPTQ